MSNLGGNFHSRQRSRPRRWCIYRSPLPNTMRSIQLKKAAGWVTLRRGLNRRRREARGRSNLLERSRSWPKMIRIRELARNSRSTLSKSWQIPFSGRSIRNGPSTSTLAQDASRTNPVDKEHSDLLQYESLGKCYHREQHKSHCTAIFRLNRRSRRILTKH